LVTEAHRCEQLAQGCYTVLPRVGFESVTYRSQVQHTSLSRRRLDVFHTSTHGVALVRIYEAGLKHAARGSPKIQDAKSHQKSPSGHYRTTLLAISSQLRHISTIGKNLLSSNVSSTYPYNMVNLGPLAGEVVWGTPASFSGFRILAALLHDTPVLGISQTLRR